MIAYSTVTESDYARSAANVCRRFRELIERLLAVEPPRYTSRGHQLRATAGLVVKLEVLLGLVLTTGRRFKRTQAQARTLRSSRSYFNPSKVNARNLP